MRTILFVYFTLAIAPALVAGDVDFAADVFPILQKHCAGCHNAEDAESGFAIDSHAGLLRGGDSGSAITPGASSSSRMLLMASGQIEPKMPPEDEPPLSADDLAILANWIDQGASGPDGEPPIKRSLSTPQIKPASVKSPITAISLSRDGEYQAIARFGAVTIQRVAENTVTTITGQPGKVNSLDFSHDGTKILIGSGVTGAYGRASIHSVETGDLVTEFVGHRDTIYAAVFSPDESMIATAGYDREIRLWDSATGDLRNQLKGHNGAIYDLAFSPDGQVLVSACADETVKVWNVRSGERLDTLGQCEGEVFAVDISADGNLILAASADNRFRVWRLLSKDSPRINPLVTTRFVDETPLVNFKMAPDGKSVVVLSQSAHAKVLRANDWNYVGTLESLDDTATDLVISPDGKFATIALMNGELARRRLPATDTPEPYADDRYVQPVFIDLGKRTELNEPTLRESQTDAVLNVDRGVEILGTIEQPNQQDLYAWRANAGEVWAIDADANQDSSIDPIVTILDHEGRPVPRIRLQAIIDSYFTFRGKDSTQDGDFRVFNWQQMHLGDYLYSGGEVNRLAVYPRGPDSGFNVFPGLGNRWTYFGTSGTTHALGEPAYIVRPLGIHEAPIANGLPVFDIHYENDDDPMRVAGTSSRLLFTAPADGRYTVRIADTRGQGSPQHGYKLTIRAAKPRFEPSIGKPNGTLLKGVGREFSVRIDRIDGFDGQVTFEVEGLPPQIRGTSPVTVEAGQRIAFGTLWVDKDAQPWDETCEPTVAAHAMIEGRRVERRAGTLGKLKLGDLPNATPTIHPIDREAAADEMWTLQVRRGETVSARVVMHRKEGFDTEVSFGKEDAGRNATQGVYVDNIGLNGLLVRAGETEREFFLTADPTAAPGARTFFLTGQTDGNVTTHPITVDVLP